MKLLNIALIGGAAVGLYFLMSKKKTPAADAAVPADPNAGAGDPSGGGGSSGGGGGLPGDGHVNTANAALGTGIIDPGLGTGIVPVLGVGPILGTTQTPNITVNNNSNNNPATLTPAAVKAAATAKVASLTKSGVLGAKSAVGKAPMMSVNPVKAAPVQIKPAPMPMPHFANHVAVGPAKKFGHFAGDNPHYNNDFEY